MRIFGVFKRGVGLEVGDASGGGERGEGGKRGGEAVGMDVETEVEEKETVKRGGTDVDAGLGKTGEGEVEVEEETEDRRVLGAALAAVCNIVNEFSPLRPVGSSRPSSQ